MLDTNDFIEIYDNSTPQKLCDELVSWFDLCSDKNFTEHNMPFPNGIKKTTYKSDEAIGIPNSTVSSLSISDDVVFAFWDVLNKSLRDYLEKYDITEMELSCYLFKLHKVKKGQGYHVWHHENYGTYMYKSRILAWMTYLKVPEEGGETEFLYQSKRIKPVVGRTLIWPAYFTHLHRGNPPLKGEKYYITGWFEKE
jgi:hypothetical protein